MHPRLLVVFVLLCASLPRAGNAAAPPVETIVPDDFLVLPPVGNYGRNPLPLDFLQADIVAGRWKAPRAGDQVAVPGGRARTWEKQPARAGALTHPALRGGYAFWQVSVPSARVLILEASGHLTVRINGEPRTGDPYSNGTVRLPVALRAGVNDLLFHCPRGQLRARLVPAAISINSRDATLPDLIAGEKDPTWGDLIVINAGDRPASDLALVATLAGGAALRTPVPPLPPLTARKIAFRIPPTTGKAGDTAPLAVRLQAGAEGRERSLDSVRLTLSVRDVNDLQKRTFLSDIDGSVQYYALRPAKPTSNPSPPGLVLTLHGAGVEAIGQARCYHARPWTHVVAPTNRRAFGFDWEDWGRLDAMEVLELASQKLKPDPRRIYLTGHSMGGHGVWHLGATFPDRWAAIAPSAGWVSFASYGGGRQSTTTPMQQFLLRPAAPSNTTALKRNYAGLGVYVLHGDADDNVPVSEARFMRKQLGDFHPDFTYYERPGAGHWWGDACMDWPPLFDFLQARTLPRPEDVRRVDFVTASPGVSAWCHWAGVEAQIKPMELSEVHLRYQPAQRRFTGSTVNVARLALDLAHLKPGGPLEIELDGEKLGTAPGKTARLWLERKAGKWSYAARPPASEKGPHRQGPFKEVFRNRVMFVYGTHGTPAENAWAFAQARFDAETFWYRGNGSIDVVSDAQFDPAAEPDRNVVLYGHAESNAAWKALLGKSPVQVRRGEVKVGERREKGDLACLFVRPRPGSDRALVGVVAGSGPAGQRLTEVLPYFVSGVGYPDCIVLGPELLTRGSAGVRAAGFFGVDWGVASGEFLWRKEG